MNSATSAAVTLSQIPVPRPGYMTPGQTFGPSPLTPGQAQVMPYQNCATVACSVPTSAHVMAYNTGGMHFTFPPALSQGYMQQQAALTPTPSSAGDMRLNPAYLPHTPRMMAHSLPNNYVQQTGPNSETNKQNNGTSTDHREHFNSHTTNVSPENNKHSVANSRNEVRTSEEDKTKSTSNTIPSETKIVSFPGLANLMKLKTANSNKEDDYDS